MKNKAELKEVDVHKTKKKANIQNAIEKLKGKKWKRLTVTEKLELLACYSEIDIEEE